jgi:tetratricopeptide (TPR) repeat protein
VAIGVSRITLSAEPDDARARARQLAADGAAAYKTEQYGQAIARFEAAYRLYPAVPLLLNLSRAELKLGRCTEALHYAQQYKTAVADAETASVDSPDEWLGTVQRSCIEAEVDSKPAGATIWIDDQRQTSPDKTPWSGRLPVGKHKVLLWLPGYQKQGAFLTVSPATPASLTLTLFPTTQDDVVPPLPGSAPVASESRGAKPSPTQAPLDATRPMPRPLLHKLGLSAIAVGGAALVTALALSIVVGNENSAAARITGPRTAAQADALLSRSHSEASAEDGLFAAGGVLAAAGIPLTVVF